MYSQRACETLNTEGGGASVEEGWNAAHQHLHDMHSNYAMDLIPLMSEPRNIEAESPLANIGVHAIGVDLNQKQPTENNRYTAKSPTKISTKRDTGVSQSL